MMRYERGTAVDRIGDQTGAKRGPVVTLRTGRVNWEAERARYVAGTESFAAIARRLGVTRKAVQLHATSHLLPKTWAEMRADWRRAQSAAVLEKTAEAQGELLSRFALNRLRFADRCLTRMLEIDPATLTFRELLEGAKLGIDTHLQINMTKLEETVVRFEPLHANAALAVDLAIKAILTPPDAPALSQAEDDDDA